MVNDKSLLQQRNRFLSFTRAEIRQEKFYSFNYPHQLIMSTEFKLADNLFL